MPLAELTVVGSEAGAAVPKLVKLTGEAIGYFAVLFK
jgi:hypothetical protein